MSDPFKDVAEAAAGEPSPEVTFWTKETSLARKREKSWREKAKKVTELYEAAKVSSNSFNILYANTETLLPAVYNQTPRPLVERRHKDADPLGLQAATVMERTLQYLVDSPDAEYERYDDLFRQAALAALVPGRGVTWWSYHPEIEGAAPSVGDGEGDKAEAGESVADDETVSGKLYPAGEKVTWETVCGEVIPYDKFLCGYALRWKDVPWVAREHAMSKEDAEENFGEEIAEKLEYLADSQEDEKREQGTDEGKNQGSVKTACVYEIWWKQKKQVVFYAPSLKEKLCRDPMDDPYGLTGFYPCPEPLQFLRKLSSIVPTPIYEAYAPQAKELNTITLRINRIINAMKVRGFYDHSVQGLNELLSKDDNTLIPAKNVAAMKEGAGANLSNSIWFMPLDMLMETVKELYVAQEVVKNTIYEITGIADIMRGSTQASETATAQNIKDKWGGLRLQNMQGATQGYIRDCLRIVAELAGKHFGQPTFAGMTNLDYATSQELAQAQQMRAAIDAAMMQLPQQPPQAPGLPPSAPPQLPPQIQQAMQEVEATLAKPQWGPVLALLKDNLQRGYKIDIETNSTLANTSAEDQENITKAMGAIGTAMQQFLPAVQTGVMTLPAVKEILLAMARRFEFGRTVETAIQQMPDQLPPPPPDPKADAEYARQKEEIAGREEVMQKQELGLAGREAEIAQKAQEVSGQIKEAERTIDTKAKEAMSAQEISQQKFLLDMERRLAKHEMAMQKGLQQQKATADRASLDNKKAIDSHKESSDKVMPMIQDLGKALQETTKQTIEAMTKVLSADVELVKDPKTGAKRARRVLQ